MISRRALQQQSCGEHPPRLGFSARSDYNRYRPSILSRPQYCLAPSQEPSVIEILDQTGRIAIHVQSSLLLHNFPSVFSESELESLRKQLYQISSICRFDLIRDSIYFRKYLLQYQTGYGHETCYSELQTDVSARHTSYILSQSAYDL